MERTIQNEFNAVTQYRDLKYIYIINLTVLFFPGGVKLKENGRIPWLKKHEEKDKFEPFFTQFQTIYNNVRLGNR